MATSCTTSHQKHDVIRLFSDDFWECRNETNTETLSRKDRVLVSFCWWNLRLKQPLWWRQYRSNSQIWKRGQALKNATSHWTGQYGDEWYRFRETWIKQKRLTVEESSITREDKSKGRNLGRLWFSIFNHRLSWSIHPSEQTWASSRWIRLQKWQPVQKKWKKKNTLRVHVEKCSRIKAKPTYLPSVTKGLTCKSLQEMYVGTTYNLQTTLSWKIKCKCIRRQNSKCRLEPPTRR